MNPHLALALARSHQHDLLDAAERANSSRLSARADSIVVRRATPDDQRALARLPALGSSPGGR